VHERELVIVRLTDADGVEGIGECAPLPPYDGTTPEQVEAALERCRDPLGRAAPAQGAPRPDPRLLAECAAACALPQALAGIDIALWDLTARRHGRPLAELLAVPARPADAVAVNATISALDRAGAAEQAARAVERGYGCLKVKIGRGDDAGRVAAVRAAAGAAVDLRLDANGAFDVPRARATIEALSPAGLELVEEPVHGVEATRELRRLVSVRIAIDETAGEPGALEPGVADAVCLKLGRCGGITPLLASARRVRAGGAEVYLASALDGPVGIGAAVHAAAALAAEGPLPACGLATLQLFAGLPDPLAPRGGEITVPPRPGLGISA
jgi:L-alanine-DL-glutamate epimerase-like enolase superfamily enzyme